MLGSTLAIAGVPLGTFIADHWRWQDAFVMVAIITTVATVVAFTVLPRNLQAGKGSYRQQLVLFKDKDIWEGIFFVICAAATLYGYYTYIRPLIHKQLGFDLNELSFILLLLGVVDILANQTSGRIASRSGFKTLRPIYVLDLFLLLLFAPAMTNKWLGLVLLFVLSYFVCLFGSPIQVYFLNQASHKYPAAVMLASTFNAIFFNVGIALSSMTAGETLKWDGLSSLGLNSFAYCFFAMILCFVLARKWRQN